MCVWLRAVNNDSFFNPGGSKELGESFQELPCSPLNSNLVTYSTTAKPAIGPSISSASPVRTNRLNILP